MFNTKFLKFSEFLYPTQVLDFAKIYIDYLSEWMTHGYLFNL